MSLSSDLQELNVRTAAAVHSWASELERLTTPLVQRAEQLEQPIKASVFGPILEQLGKVMLEQPDVELVASLVARIGKPIVAAVEAEAAGPAPVPAAPGDPYAAGPPSAGPIEDQARAAVTS